MVLQLFAMTDLLKFDLEGTKNNVDVKNWCMLNHEYLTVDWPYYVKCELILIVSGQHKIHVHVHAIIIIITYNGIVVEGYYHLHSSYRITIYILAIFIKVAMLVQVDDHTRAVNYIHVHMYCITLSVIYHKSGNFRC